MLPQAENQYKCCSAKLVDDCPSMESLDTEFSKESCPGCSVLGRLGDALHSVHLLNV